jgi:5'-nucleotidase
LEHLQVLLVTDAHPRVLALKHEITGLLDHVPDVYCSHDFGAPKQHADFWSGLASAVPFNPARTLMIDDSINVLRQAQAYGIGQTIYIEQPDSGRIRDNDHLRSEQFPSLNDLSSLVAS